MSNQPVEKYEDSELYRIRHSAAHVMAQAVFASYLPPVKQKLPLVRPLIKVFTMILISRAR
jgi:threonyl-tRNA synthetase